MSTWTSEVSRQIVTKHCPYETIVTTSAIVGKIDVASIDKSECRQLKEIDFELRFRDKSIKTIHGIVVYFEVHFDRGKNGKVTLTNSPLGELTHWQQSLCLFEVGFC